MLRVCLGCFGSMMFGNVSVPPERSGRGARLFRGHL